jgi:hypothetical protein
MGLLDDAIREHLDLKRRRGADPSEIAKEEADALGPVRRDAPEEEPAFAPDPEPEPEERGSVRMDPEPPADLAEPAAVYDEDEPPRVPAADPSTTHDHIWAEPEEESATPPHGDPLAHQQTREFSSTELGEALGRDDDVVPAEAEPEDDEAEDELEETPDFLQETPEHDRLWFEQKPPKDFDF